MRMQRWLIAVAVTLGAVAVLPSLAVAEPSGTISLSVSSNPTVRTPFSVTATGTSSQEGTLHVWLLEGAQTCPSEGKQSLFQGDGGFSGPIAAGSFSQESHFDLNGLGGPYTLCGYLTAVVGLASETYATATDELQVAGPSGSVGFTIGEQTILDPEDKADGETVVRQITMSGTTSIEAFVAALVEPPGQTCPAELPEGELEDFGDSYAENVVSPGSFSFSFNVAREAESGTYLLCGYVAEPQVEGPTFATGTSSFQTPFLPYPPLPSDSPIPPEAPPSGLPSLPAAASKATASPPPSPHLTTLTVRARTQPGGTAAKPGKTELLVHVTPGVTLRLALKRHGHTYVERFGMGTHSAVTLTVPWSCSAPGGVYSYTITATDAYGASLTRTGKFRPVTAARCRALKIENEPLPETPHERQHEKQEEAHRQHVEADQRAYCNDVLGGTVLLQDGVAEETECVVGSLVYQLKGDSPRVVHVRRNG